MNPPPKKKSLIKNFIRENVKLSSLKLWALSMRLKELKIKVAG